ncbi:MAG: 30S ribosomal protein S11 [Deltaproteobacteria bacterium]|nr:30S ribosomal protein S11 [Deltaproteobacteria bacterium]MCX7952342.1 30S ribosomal protein S11 [Deltaproteobacteria bacterium]
MATTATKDTKKKTKKNIPNGLVYIFSSFNNTLISVTDPQGQVLCQTSAGACGFKGTKKGTPFAAQVAGSRAAEKAKEFGMKTVGVLVKGIGAGRETAIRAIAQSGLKIKYIRDTTPIPHNGPRPRKTRRV